MIFAGNYGELAMITLPLPVRARFVILGIVSFDKNPCLKVRFPPSPSFLQFSYHPFLSLSSWAAKMFLLKKDTLDSTTASPSALTTNLQRSGVTS